MASKPTHTTCQFIDCNQPISYMSPHYCEYHREGGMFGDGESYDQYQIIEQDFIDFIKVVPLEEAHFKVHSPLLRDIIIRTCVQIEIFFKEWSKLSISENSNSDHAKALLAKYNRDSKKERNWSIGDYYGFKDELNNNYTSLHVMPLNKNIKPFDSWKGEKTPPTWWQVYNGIKHGSNQDKKAANLEAALHTLAGLFLMHCVNWPSRSYLRKFNTHKFEVSPANNVELLRNDDITTPLDSKKYLFKETQSRFTTKIKLATEESIRDNLRDSRLRGGF